MKTGYMGYMKHGNYWTNRYNWQIVPFSETKSRPLGYEFSIWINSKLNCVRAGLQRGEPIQELIYELVYKVQKQTKGLRNITGLTLIRLVEQFVEGGFEKMFYTYSGSRAVKIAYMTTDGAVHDYIRRQYEESIGTTPDE